MSFAVVHVQKFKISDVKGMQKHNQRESLNSKNPDIDRDKTALNYDLHNPDQQINYNHRVKDIIQEGYTGTKAIRKDAVVMTSTLISSDREFFKELPPQEQRRFFEVAYKELKELYGEKNIVSATVHMDERTPHMHLCSVPLTNEGKLSAKSLFDRQGLRILQDEIPKCLKSQGFDIQRGESSDKKHMDTTDYKKELTKEVESLEHKSKALQNNLKAVQSDLKAIQSDLIKIEGVKVTLERIDSIQAKEGGLLSRGKVTLSKKDYEELRTVAKKYFVLENKVNILERQNQSLSKDVDKLYSGRQDNQLRTNDTHRQLVAVNSKLGLLVDFLKATDQIEKADRYVQQQTSVKVREDEHER